MLNSGILHLLSHLLSLAGLSCFLLAAMWIAGVKPMKLLRSAWGRLKESSKSSTSALPVAGAQTKGVAIKWALVLAIYTLAVYSVGYSSGRHSHAKEFEAWKQRSSEWQRTYAKFIAKHKELQ